MRSDFAVVDGLVGRLLVDPSAKEESRCLEDCLPVESEITRHAVGNAWVFGEMTKGLGVQLQDLGQATI